MLDKPIMVDMDTEFPAYLRGIETPQQPISTSILRGSQPTYEGLKLPLTVHLSHLSHSSQPTYEGLKSQTQKGDGGMGERSFPAYLRGIETL